MQIVFYSLFNIYKIACIIDCDLDKYELALKIVALASFGETTFFGFQNETMIA